MNLQSPKKTPEQMVEAIFALDLDPIKFKLMDKKEGLGWTREKVDMMELEYRRFLALIAKFPDETIAPSSDVDKFWHGHILDTMKYSEDCQQVFGYFLHHFPYFGMRDQEDAANLAAAAKNTRRLYEQEFGSAAAANAAYCGRVAGTADAPSEQDVAYCGEITASYCGRMADKVSAASEQDVAYCGEVTASYCGRMADRVSAASEQDVAYCGEITASASYCGRAAGISAGQAYCGATSVNNEHVLLRKGRPTLEPVAA